LLINEKRDSFLPSGSWIALFWLPAETLSLKRLLEFRDLNERVTFFSFSRNVLLGSRCMWDTRRPDQAQDKH